MKSESSAKYVVGLGVALVAAIALHWYLSGLLCPPRGCRARSDFFVNFFLVWMPSFIAFIAVAASIMMTWEKFERQTADMDSAQFVAAESPPAADGIAPARAAYDRGWASLQHGDFRDAIREFDLAISLDPTDSYAFIARGNAYAELKQFEQAFADYERALARDPRSVPAHYNRGRTLQDVGDTVRAIADFDAALRLRPGYVPALHSRGIALQTLGESGRAIADFRQALSLATDDATRRQLESRLAALSTEP
jgi:tetratricopeptide (TPR) repeat protein